MTAGFADQAKAALLAAFVILLPTLVLAGYFYWSTRLPSECEDAIKRTLKAPSTYRLISSSSGPPYDVEYDASNSYGVPLRSTGICTTDADGIVEWSPSP